MQLPSCRSQQLLWQLSSRLLRLMPRPEPRGSPAIAATRACVADQDRWTAQAFASLPVPLPMARIRDQTAFRAVAEFFERVTDSARWWKLQSEDRRGAPPLDNRSRNIPERPPRCTTLRASGLRDKWIRRARAKPWLRPLEMLHRDLPE